MPRRRAISPVVRGAIAIAFGVTFCILQATHRFGATHSNGYLYGILLIVFGSYWLYAGVTKR